MDAHGRKSAARRLVAMRAPLRGLQHKRVRKRHRGFDVKNRAKTAGPDALAQFVHLGMEAAVVAQPQRHSRLSRGFDCGFRVFFREAERLFTKDMLAGPGSSNNLLRMLGMRRGKYDRIE